MKKQKQEVTDPTHQVPATFDADSGIVEVFPTDKEWTGVMLGIRCDVGPGAFVRLTRDERNRLVSMLSPDATHPEPGDDVPYDDSDPAAQDVIDALRFVFMAQDDPDERKKLVDHFLELAPETMTNGGFDLIKDLLAEGTLKVQVNA